MYVSVQKLTFANSASLDTSTPNLRKNNSKTDILSAKALNQSINQSINQPINQSVSQSVSPSISQSVCQSLNQAVKISQ